MTTDQKQAYMQAVHYRGLSDRFMRSAYTVMLGAIFLWFIGISPGYMAFMLSLGIIVAGVAFYLRERYWKCPACGERLPSKESAWQVERCPKCGLTLAGEGQQS